MDGIEPDGNRHAARLGQRVGGEHVEAIEIINNPSSRFDSQVPENREQYVYTIRGGSDFTLTDTNTITISGVHNYEHHIDVAQVPFILQATGDRERFWFWREDGGTGFTNANVDLTHRFGAPGHELSVNIQFTRGKEEEAYSLNEESPVRIGTDDTHIIAIENTLPLSIDYTRPLQRGRLSPRRQ